MTQPTPARRRRLCVFEFDLTCGHLVTVSLEGWYPVGVACCDRLGGTIRRGRYVPYDSDIDYARVREERYEWCPADTPVEPTRLLDRQARTDQPRVFAYGRPSTGRFPAYVGAAVSFDGTIPSTVGDSHRP